MKQIDSKLTYIKRLNGNYLLYSSKYLMSYQMGYVINYVYSSILFTVYSILKVYLELTD